MNAEYLIDHWSYSSLRSYTSNRFGWLNTYVLKTTVFKSSVSGLVGKAAHKAIEAIYKGASIQEGVGVGLSYIENIPDSEVKWGKTGSREKAGATYTFAINAFLSEIEKPKEILAVEEPITAFIKPITPFPDMERAWFALPLKCVPDLVQRNEAGEIEIKDWKFVSAFSDDEEERPARILQAICSYHAVSEKFGTKPKRMCFHECKVSANKDGSPQMRTYVIDFDDPELLNHFAAFYTVYDGCTREIAREDALFIPNFNDIFDGDETYKLFVGQTVGIERPKAVMHKVEDKEIKEYNYVESVADRVDNQFLTDEERIRLKLQEFGIAVEMRETFTGPNIIKYTFKPSRSRRMAEFAKLDKDLAIALKATSVRIEAPIMGTDLVGVEVPNPNRTFVKFEQAAEEPTGTLNVPMGMDVYGNIVTKNLAEAPHMLVAGTTGSGKSVFINVLIRALIAQNTAEQMRLVLIDPKRVELSGYKDDPHLMAKPIYEVDDAIETLIWLTEEMERRYEALERIGARNIEEYNAVVPSMPRIVVVVDEFADLILQTKAKKAKGERNQAEDAIVRLAQKARAVGIHVVLGTQRPSVDVVTGIIKANFPTRVAFATVQEVDSRTILDTEGAEALLGKGDMLMLDPARRDLVRLQSFYV